MSFSTSDGPIPTAKLRLDMQKAMQSDAAVFRCVVSTWFFFDVPDNLLVLRKLSLRVWVR